MLNHYVLHREIFNKKRIETRYFVLAFYIAISAKHSTLAMSLTVISGRESEKLDYNGRIRYWLIPKEITSDK